MHVVIAGAGVIGLATAWRALARGLAVTVVDPAPGSEASGVSAGMLPAGNENLYDQEELLRLCVASRDRYPSFVAELEEIAGISTGHRLDGVLEVACDAGDLEVLHGLGRWQRSLGLASRTLTAAECRELEPRLSGEVGGGLLNPEDGSVDPRRLMAALTAAVERLGGTLLVAEAAEVVVAGGRATGIRLTGGDVVHGDRVVLAMGAWTHRIGGLPPGTVPAAAPEKGQTIRLRGAPGHLARTMRGLVHGTSLYVVPRADGELVIGATHEFRGFDTTPTGGGVRELLDTAHRLLPDVGELRFTETGAGLRPGSPDGLPLLGATAVDGLLLAAGHARGGVQLTPVTGDVMAEALVTGELPEVAKPFSPLRFT